jgi:hypothetical protein
MMRLRAVTWEAWYAAMAAKEGVDTAEPVR